MKGFPQLLLMVLTFIAYDIAIGVYHQIYPDSYLIQTETYEIVYGVIAIGYIVMGSAVVIGLIKFFKQ